MRALLCILLLASCSTGPAVHGRCSPAGLDEALADACERWPETCAVGDRMDFYCVDADDIDSVSRCGGMHDKLQACTSWLGSSVARGRVYVLEGVSVAAAAEHEAQHWHLWGDLESNACETHTADCGWIE